MSPTSPPPTNYTQGYSPSTTSTHASRTVSSDAAFLTPHISPTSTILDVGCGPGSITTGLAALAPQGSVTGIDLSDAVLAQARAHFTSVSTSSPSPLAPTTFLRADLLAGLPFPDDHFDVAFSSQLFVHLRTPAQRTAALAEMSRVLKPGGVVGTREAAAMHFFPTSYNLDHLWAGNMAHCLGGFHGGEMPGGASCCGLLKGGGRGRDDGAQWR